MERVEMEAPMVSMKELPREAEITVALIRSVIVVSFR